MGTRVIAIGIDQLPAELARGEKRFRKGIEAGLRRGAERGRSIMVRVTPTDAGQLRASWKVKGEGLAVQLINDAPHAGIVEMGARPHAVSPEGWQAIYEWVRRHPALYGRKRKRTKVSATPAQQAAMGPFRGIDPEISAITNAICHKLRVEGQKPTFFVLGNINRVRDAMIYEVEQAIERANSRRGEEP